jgi:hypothetical protein
MREIELTKGRVALVDDDDFDRLNQYKWCLGGDSQYTYYARRQSGRENIFMHRVILDAPADLHVDHIDGDGLNNQRSNLRLVTRSQNHQNRRPDTNARSRYKGVSWVSAYSKWRATIKVQGKRYSLGYHANEVDAARAYDTAARLHYGEYARLNLS